MAFVPLDCAKKNSVKIELCENVFNSKLPLIILTK